MASVPYPEMKPQAGVVRSLLGDPTGAVRLRHVALPTEHGGWGFILEPIVLGFAVAPSGAGLLIGLAAFFAFLARQPLKNAMIDGLRRKTYPRTVVSHRFFVLYALLGAVLFAAAVRVGGTAFLVPILIAAPLGIVQLWYDARNSSRSLLPELTAPVAIAAVAPAIVIAGGEAAPVAISLWLLLVARSIPTILYVRGRLRLERGGDYSALAVGGAHVAAVLAALALYVGGIGSLLAIVAMLLLFGRSIAGLSTLRSNISAKALGFREIGFGAVAVALFALGVLLPL